MEFDLTGKVALITGGSHGIGLATALALADEGCAIAICARTQSRLVEAVAEVKRRGVEAIGVAGDATVLEDVRRIFSSVIAKWSTIHILINNVGGGGRWGSPVVEETAEDVWMDVYSKNALATIRFTSLAIPYMRKQGWGRVVTVTSIYGREGGGRPWFNMAKSAEISLMKTLAMTPYLARSGITFNSVAPGHIMIPGTGSEADQQRDPAGYAAWVDKELPLGRMGKAEEVANVITFLCSEKASLVNGASITVDGGESRSF